MKTIDKTNKKVIVEITSLEIADKGFDALWDEIREVYPEHIYEVEGTDETFEGKIILITLIKKKSNISLT